MTTNWRRRADCSSGSVGIGLTLGGLAGGRPLLVRGQESRRLHRALSLASTATRRRRHRVEFVRGNCAAIRFKASSRGILNRLTNEPALARASTQRPLAERGGSSLRAGNDPRLLAKPVGGQAAGTGQGWPPPPIRRMGAWRRAPVSRARGARGRRSECYGRRSNGPVLTRTRSCFRSAPHDAPGREEELLVPDGTARSRRPDDDPRSRCGRRWRIHAVAGEIA